MEYLTNLLNATFSQEHNSQCVCDTLKCIPLNKWRGAKFHRKYACYTRQQYNILIHTINYKGTILLLKNFIVIVLTKNNIKVCQS